MGRAVCGTSRQRIPPKGGIAVPCQPSVLCTNAGSRTVSAARHGSAGTADSRVKGSGTVLAADNSKPLSHISLPAKRK
ncbi:MAG: hypothetical protein RBS80_20280 [Thermoguttaceae bacterium]|nr:hypothetical protein [Thermoguttaceae bacterium]